MRVSFSIPKEENASTHPFPLPVLLVLYEGPQIRVNKFLDLVNRLLQNILRVRSNVEVQGWVPIRCLGAIRIPRSFRAHGRPSFFVNLNTENEDT